MTFNTQSFIIFHISSIFARDIRPFKAFCRFCPTVNTKRRFTKFSHNPIMKTDVSNIISFPSRTTYTIWMIAGIPITFLRAIFSTAIFYYTCMNFEFLATFQTFFNYPHIYLRIKRPISSCLEKTVKSLRTTLGHIIGIKNPSFLSRDIIHKKLYLTT